jgi:hypothetical protein
MEACAVGRWARLHFGQADLGDARRTRRLVKVAAALADGGSGAGGGGTITSVMNTPCQAKAAYRLLDRDEVTHEAVIRPHAALTLAATAAPGDYLLIEDTTGLSYPNRRGTSGLGPLGDDFTRGLWMHSTLALKMDWQKQEAQVLGLLGQRVWARPAERPGDRPGSHGPGKETDYARQLRTGRESQRWMAALEEAGGPMTDTTWTYVADRESDIYELFQSSWAHGWSYVIRATHRRALAAPLEGMDLMEAAARGPVRGRVSVELAREGRVAELEVRSVSLELRGPKRPGGCLEGHALHVVHVREAHRPKGRQGVCWVLLTDLPVGSLEECRRVIAIYRWRWLIEEFHKALKTGLRVEASQLSTARRIGALTGVLSVVATRLIGHKLLARHDPQTPLDAGQADGVLVEVLKKLDPPADRRPTSRWFWIAIAKLGGFQARRGDGDPGWLTLWRGWQTLMALTKGYELARGP